MDAAGHAASAERISKIVAEMLERRVKDPASDSSRSPRRG